MKQEEQKDKSSQTKESTGITQHQVLVAAAITALGVVLAAFVTGGFGLVTKYVEIRSNTNSSNQNANLGSFSNYNALSISPNSNVENQNIQHPEKAVVKPILLGTRQTLTLLPAAVDSLEWKYSCCENEIIFVSPDDKSDWAKLNISGNEHFVGLRVYLTDSSNGIDSKTLSTGQVKELENILLETESFNATITPTEIITGDDPDQKNNIH